MHVGPATYTPSYANAESQMPLVDGIKSTQMIRQLQVTSLPTRASHHSSASIDEAGHLIFSPMSPPQTDPSAGHSLTSGDYFTLPLSPPTSDPPSTSPSSAGGTHHHRNVNRIPIFAVSASLNQHKQESLAAVGFDGWLSKPIDFKRLGMVLEGVISQEARAQAKSATGDFVGGGWFD